VPFSGMPPVMIRSPPMQKAPVPQKIPHAMRREGFLFILSAVVSFVCPVICGCAGRGCCRFMAGNARFYVSPRDTDSTMPISPSSIIRLVPPEEKNGRLMPVFGATLVTTAMWIMACQAICDIMPIPSIVPK
jgi:hypothetical protein